MVLYIHFKLKCLYPTAKLQISLLELNDNCKLGQEGTILAVFNIAWHQCTSAFSSKFSGSLFMEREATWSYWWTTKLKSAFFFSLLFLFVIFVSK